MSFLCFKKFKMALQNTGLPLLRIWKGSLILNMITNVLYLCCLCLCTSPIFSFSFPHFYYFFSFHVYNNTINFRADKKAPTNAKTFLSNKDLALPCFYFDVRRSFVYVCMYVSRPTVLRAQTSIKSHPVSPHFEHTRTTACKHRQCKK